MDELVEQLRQLKVNCAQQQHSAQHEPNERQLLSPSMVTIKAVKRYAKTVLDVTWTHESRLTDQSFSGADADVQVSTIVYLLDSVEQLCQQLVITGDSRRLAAEAVLGVEFAECLHWRKGALMYALCASRLSDDQYVERDRDCDGDDERREERHSFLRHLMDGIVSLRALLTLRESSLFEAVGGPPLVRDERSLVEANIMSDTHLLAMMYVSEMAVWYATHSSAWSLYVYAEFEPREIGRRCLTVYIAAVDNCLHRMGWNCERAKRLLALL